MKTLVTAALLAALALTGFARAEDPVKTTDPVPAKPAVKKVTTEDLGETLEKMGYAPRPGKNKDGKVVGYWVDVTRGDTRITVYLFATSAGNVWLDSNLILLDDKTPATPEVLLGLLATHDALWPAYLVYNPKTKMVQLALSMDAAGFGPASLRVNLEGMMDKYFIVADAVKKAKAAEPKAEEGTSGKPNPLPQR